MNEQDRVQIQEALESRLAEIARELKENAGSFRCHGQLHETKDCLAALERVSGMKGPSSAR